MAKVRSLSEVPDPTASRESLDRLSRDALEQRHGRHRGADPTAAFGSHCARSLVALRGRRHRDPTTTERARGSGPVRGGGTRFGAATCVVARVWLPRQLLLRELLLGELLLGELLLRDAGGRLGGRLRGRSLWSLGGDLLHRHRSSPPPSPRALAGTRVYASILLPGECRELCCASPGAMCAWSHTFM